MKYKIMKAIVLFDLPMELSKQKREYYIFRKHLLLLGFTMLQYSVYVRTCPNGEYAKRLLTKVNTKSPSSGNVRFLLVTQKQFDDIKILTGEKTPQERVVSSGRLIII